MGQGGGGSRTGLRGGGNSKTHINDGGSTRGARSGVMTPTTAEQPKRKPLEEEDGPDFIGPAATEHSLEFGDDDDEEDEEDEEYVDESEMRRVVLGRVGGWVDWAVGWIDLRGEGDDEEDGEEGEGEDVERSGMEENDTEPRPPRAEEESVPKAERDWEGGRVGC